MTCEPSQDETAMRDMASKFHAHGFLSPVMVISPPEASLYLEQLNDYERQRPLTGDNRFKIHLLLPWVWDLVHHPVMVSLAQACLRTEDVWLWSSDVNVKEPNSSTHYTWHQDSTYANMEPPNAAITIWLALTDSTNENGCLVCLPGTHKDGQVPHLERQGGSSNALALGQQVEKLPLAEDMAIPMILEPGQASVHCFTTIHASFPNRSSRRRIGLALRYVSAHAIRVNQRVRESATLVSGNGHELFDPEFRPTQVLGQREIAAHVAAMALEKANYLPAGGSYT